MARTWTAVTVTADAETADSIGAFLIEQGAPGLATEDLPGEVRITAHFKDGISRAAVEQFCSELRTWFPESRPPRLQFDATAEENWADNWKSHFPPLAIGERLWLQPPWVTDHPAARLPIVVDPGMAFGTGHHASTRGCLTFLDRAIRPGHAPRVLDIGTGSGVLAIAAAKLGASAVWAVDVDADACAIATANVQANDVTAIVRVCSDIAEVPGPFDVIVANLFANELIAMASAIHDALVQHGMVIGAGVLITEAAAVEAAWERVGLSTAEHLVESEWTTMTARRR